MAFGCWLSAGVVFYQLGCSVSSWAGLYRLGCSVSPCAGLYRFGCSLSRWIVFYRHADCFYLMPPRVEGPVTVTQSDGAP